MSRFLWYRKWWFALLVGLVIWFTINLFYSKQIDLGQNVFLLISCIFTAISLRVGLMYEDPKSKKDRLFKETSKLAFLPHTVCYTASPGEVAKTRNIEEVIKVHDYLGYEVFKGKGGLLGAVVEINSKTKKPQVKTYWDSHGRVCKTEFIGDRGAIGTNGMTNIYEYNDKGLLVADYQIIHPKDRPSQIFRGSWYEYHIDHPDNEFSIRWIEIGGKETFVTYDQRRARRCGH